METPPSPDYPVSDEDVERAAQDAFFTDMIGGHHNGLFTWETIPEEGRENYRKMVTSVLAAVLPEYAKRVRADLLRELIEQPVHPLTREWLASVLERVEGE